MTKRRSLLGRIIDTRVDKWMSWNYLSETSSRIKNTVTDIAKPQRAKYHETFEEAMLRMNLTEADLIKRKKEFTRLFYFFITIGLAIIGYAVFMATKGLFAACLISFCLSGFSFAQAFKWHFWLFQLSHRKLGCTFKEWLDGNIITQNNTKNELALKKEKSSPPQRKNQ